MAQEKASSFSIAGRKNEPLVGKKSTAPSNAASVDVFQCCKGSGGSSNHNHGPPGLDPHRKGSAWSITNMPPDIAELAIDRPVNVDMKVCNLVSYL